MTHNNKAPKQEKEKNIFSIPAFFFDKGLEKKEKIRYNKDNKLRA